MRMEVSSRRQVLETNEVSIFERLSKTVSLSQGIPPCARFVVWTSDNPKTVWIIVLWETCNRLLSASTSICDLMRMKTEIRRQMHQFDYTSASYTAEIYR